MGPRTRVAPERAREVATRVHADPATTPRAIIARGHSGLEMVMLVKHYAKDKSSRIALTEANAWCANNDPGWPASSAYKMSSKLSGPGGGLK